MNLVHAWRALGGIMRRELLRNLRQTGRLGAAIVRPLVWLAIFAAGFRAVLGLSIIPPYETYILYEVYLVPGLVVSSAYTNASWLRKIRSVARPISPRSPRAT